MAKFIHPPSMLNGDVARAGRRRRLSGRIREVIDGFVGVLLFLAAPTALSGIADLLHGGHGCTVGDIDVVAGPRCEPDDR